jgi:hypothetical protein
LSDASRALDKLAASRSLVSVEQPDNLLEAHPLGVGTSIAPVLLRSHCKSIATSSRAIGTSGKRTLMISKRRKTAAGWRPPAWRTLLSGAFTLLLMKPGIQAARVTERACLLAPPAAGVSPGLFFSPPGADDGWHPHLRFSAGLARVFVNFAIAGAGRRLENEECQQVFTDFQDGTGRTLATNLADRRQDPPSVLRDLWFVDATATDSCLQNDLLAAYTAPGSHVIWVCGSRFADPASSLRGQAGEIVIIHELLHALGLPENPPSSAEITGRVTDRCGDHRRASGARTEI